MEARRATTIRNRWPSYFWLPEIAEDAVRQGEDKSKPALFTKTVKDAAPKTASTHCSVGRQPGGALSRILDCAELFVQTYITDIEGLRTSSVLIRATFARGQGSFRLAGSK
jgi:hypothetical protein